MLAGCDEEIAAYLRELDSKIDVQQHPLPPPANPHRPRKNEFRFDLRQELYRVLGMDLTAVPGLNVLSAHTLLAEVGRDVSRFPNAAAFASWLGLFYRRLRSWLGAPKAITATAYKLARFCTICCACLTEGVQWSTKG